MSESQDPINSFISEINASLQQSDPSAFLRRVNAERLLILTVNELMDEHQTENIRIIPDNRLTGNNGADFLLQVDDYDFRIELLDTANDNLHLSPDNLATYITLLEENPSTLDLIVVWSTDTLLAVPFSLTRLHYLSQNNNKISGLIHQAQPIKMVMNELIQRQIKIWDVGTEQLPQTTGQGIDIYKTFSEEIGKAIDAEMHRKYLVEERRQAATQFPYQEEKQLILSVLQDALKGIEADKLIERLVRVQKRGGK
jgi:hypothetical protein